MTASITKLGAQVCLNTAPSIITTTPKGFLNTLGPVTEKIIQACGGLERFHSIPEIAFKPKFLGATSYITVREPDLKENALNVARGTDPYGRMFLCLKTEVRSFRPCSSGTLEKGIVTLFQRHVSKKPETLDIWVCSSDDFLPIFNQISHPDSKEVQTLQTLLRGEQAYINYLGDKALARISTP